VYINAHFSSRLYKKYVAVKELKFQDAKSLGMTTDIRRSCANDTYVYFSHCSLL